MNRCGVVGEETDKPLGYLGAVSRKLEHPLAERVQSSSAAGKSSLMATVLAFMPEEGCIQYSAMTGQPLFYPVEQDQEHKILAIAEVAGVSNASIGRNAVTGNLETQEYKVESPLTLFSTTASEMNSR